MKSEDIARIAGVSRSTVSRVINNYPNVPPETRERVMKIVREYNYAPNTSARALAGKKSNTIGLFLIVDGKHYESDRINQNDYFRAYLDYLVEYASMYDFYVLVSVITGENKYYKIEQAFIERRIDAGIIIGTQADTLNKIHSESRSSQMIVFDYDMSKSDKEHFSKSKISTINSMDYKGIHDAVEYLYNKGHRKIGFIKGNPKTRSGRVRYDAFLHAMNVYDLFINHDYIIEGNFDNEIAYAKTKEMINTCIELPTAMISANDFMALRAIDAINEEGLSVPKDMSIIGFDNTLHGQIAEPGLTTMGPDFEAMSKKAIELLKKQLEDKVDAKHLKYEVNFYERESCRSLL